MFPLKKLPLPNVPNRYFCPSIQFSHMIQSNVSRRPYCLANGVVLSPKTRNGTSIQKEFNKPIGNVIVKKHVHSECDAIIFAVDETRRAFWRREEKEEGIQQFHRNVRKRVRKYAERQKERDSEPAKFSSLSPRAVRQQRQSQAEHRWALRRSQMTHDRIASRLRRETAPVTRNHPNHPHNTQQRMKETQVAEDRAKEDQVEETVRLRQEKDLLQRQRREEIHAKTRRKAAERYAEALRWIVAARVTDRGVPLPPLCGCAADPLVHNVTRCDVKCPYYRQPLLFNSDLLWLLQKEGVYHP